MWRRGCRNACLTVTIVLCVDSYQKPTPKPTDKPTPKPSPKPTPVPVPPPLGLGCPIQVPKNKRRRERKNNVCRFDNIISFGDSLADIGLSTFFPDCNSEQSGIYCGDRTSNGPLVVDFVAAQYGLGPLTVGGAIIDTQVLPSGGNSFAVAGSRARAVEGAHFQPQVQLYRTAIGVDEVDGFTPNLNVPTMHTLHNTIIGGNDVYDAIFAYILGTGLLGDAGEVPSPISILDAAVAAMAAQLMVLYEMENVCNVVVWGSIDLAETPFFRAMQDFYAPTGVDILGNATEFTEYFNAKLQETTEGMTDDFAKKCRRSPFGILYVDLVALNGKIDLVAEFTEPRAACTNRFISDAATCLASVASNFSVPLVPISTDGSKVLCSAPVLPTEEWDCDCEGFVFFDDYHPSAEYSMLLFNLFLEELEMACI